VILHPGQLLGIPPGVIEIPADLAWFRYLLVLLAALWAVVVARARPGAGLLAGCLYVAIVAGFWVLALGRPYGLLEDPAVTRRAAEITVRAWAAPGEGFLSGTPPSADTRARLAGAGASPGFLLLAPTFLPIVIIPALALLVHALWPARDRAAVGALLWLAFSTGGLDALRGMGVLSGAWAHPTAALGLVVSVAAVFALCRFVPAGRTWSIAGVSLGLAWWWGTGAWTGFDLEAALLALTLDQGLLLPLGWFGLLRRPEPASRALVLAGAIVVFASALPAAAPGPWGGHALYRMGLVLAAAAPVSEACAAIGERLARRVHLPSSAPTRVGAGALLLALLPGSFLTWWDPARLDPNVAASLRPISPGMVEAMTWIRRETPAAAVFVASADRAAAVASLAGRRVLRAPSLASPPDDADRRTAEEKLLYGHLSNRLARRYGVSHVLLGPGDFGAYWLGLETLESRGPFRLVYRGGDSLSIYEVPR
jgi:hypothetical protein